MTRRNPLLFLHFFSIPFLLSKNRSLQNRSSKGPGDQVTSMCNWYKKTTFQKKTKGNYIYSMFDKSINSWRFSREIWWKKADKRLLCRKRKKVILITLRGLVLTVRKHRLVNIWILISSQIWLDRCRVSGPGSPTVPKTTNKIIIILIATW